MFLSSASGAAPWPVTCASSGETWLFQTVKNGKGQSHVTEKWWEDWSRLEELVRRLAATAVSFDRDQARVGPQHLFCALELPTSWTLYKL